MGRRKIGRIGSITELLEKIIRVGISNQLVIEMTNNPVLRMSVGKTHQHI